jgi:hypothetical protein
MRTVVAVVVAFVVLVGGSSTNSSGLWCEHASAAMPRQCVFSMFTYIQRGFGADAQTSTESSDRRSAGQTTAVVVV